VVRPTCEPCPMGLGEWFLTFCSAIQVSKGSTISERYQAISRRLCLESHAAPILPVLANVEANVQACEWRGEAK